jgi:hypothetical protein
MGVLAVAAEPLALAEEYIARPITNVPFTIHNAGMHIGEHGARASLWAQQGEYGEMTLDLLYATQSGTEGFNAGLSVAIPISGALESRVAAQSTRTATSLLETSGTEGTTTIASGTGTGSAPMSVVRNIGRGEKVADIVAEVKELTFSTGNEHAVVKLATGERAIVSGGPTGITWESGQVTRLFGHSHPYHLAPTGPSPADISTLGVLGQRSSYLLEHGELTRFWGR